eukprot:maker-scaffold238_size242079-snap-gene-1.18 protein:Tk10918 transcript:maker-scaffold238_size242079-snap-gene-1.18-mRNA-1 annotation:"probable hydroxyacid-oxoacid mitochondrial-like"
MGNRFQWHWHSVSVASILIMVLFLIGESLGGLVSYKYSPIGGELRFIRTPQRPMLQRAHFTSGPRSFGFNPNARPPLFYDDLPRVSSSELAPSDEMLHEELADPKSPFENFLRLWTSPGNGRIQTGPKMNWKYFVQA